MGDILRYGTGRHLDDYKLKYKYRPKIFNMENQCGRVVKIGLISHVILFCLENNREVQNLFYLDMLDL